MSPNFQEKEIKVIAYSGYKANERPVSFVIADQEMEVKEILEQWVGQDHDYFKVLTGDGRKYLLKWNRSLDRWLGKEVERLKR